MTQLLSRLNVFAAQKDLLLILVFVTILMMMIIPLPAFVMDVMITLNVSISIMIMLMALHLHNPIQFSTFPSLLLITTLFRLAISISTTRLILLEGDAGRIVETFGNVVVGGNLVVGLVIFLIITVVQFLVITKGADRVAEVGARFTLDGMPGKQMSVDADVRAGSIDNTQAKSARQLLEKETKLFGAMDGAMKFVKGDAIAGLIITVINLVGGIAIGMTQFGYPFSEALALYSILTIGDGLVAQIPALLISVSAGTMVTRVTDPKGIDLGSEIADQITANHRTLSIAGLVIGLFGFIPGFPTMIFLAVGLSISGGIFLYQFVAAKKTNQTSLNWDSIIKQSELNVANSLGTTGIPPSVRLVLPKSIRAEDPLHFAQQFDHEREVARTAYGIPVGYWAVEINEFESAMVKLFIHQKEVSAFELQPDVEFVRANVSYLRSLDIECIKHFGNEEGVMVSKEYSEKLREAGLQSYGAITFIGTWINTVIFQNLDAFVTIQSVSAILANEARTNQDLVRDLKENLTVTQICTVLKLLVKERVPMTGLPVILEAILEWAPRKADPLQLLQQVRIAIGDSITRRYWSAGFLPVIVISPTLETLIREGLKSADEQSYLVVDSSITQVILEQIRASASVDFSRTEDPVIVTQQDIRLAVYNLLMEHGIFVPVLAYQELLPETVIYPVGFVASELE